MNPYLEQACRLFGPQSCESASTVDYIAMAFAAAFVGLLLAWLGGRLVALRSS